MVLNVRVKKWVRTGEGWEGRVSLGKVRGYWREESVVESGWVKCAKGWLFECVWCCLYRQE